MAVLRGFIPWIAYAVIANWGWQWGALAGLIAGVALLLADRRSGVRADAQILEISGALFFALLTVAAFARPDSGIDEYDGALAFGWLAVTAWFSLVVRRPFTEGIAKREVAEEHWGSPVFRRINVVITLVWAASFTAVCAALTTSYLLQLSDVVDTVAQVAGFVVPITFTNWYKEAAAGRARAQHIAAG